MKKINKNRLEADVLSHCLNMKVFSFLFLVFFILLISGCATAKITVFSNTYPPKAEDAKIDIYMTTMPTQKYIEFAQIKCNDLDDTWNMQHLLKKAREIGADGVIIIGKAGSTGVVISNIYLSEQYGISAIAIKYKDS